MKVDKLTLFYLASTIRSSSVEHFISLSNRKEKGKSSAKSIVSILDFQFKATKNSKS